MRILGVKSLFEIARLGSKRHFLSNSFHCTVSRSLTKQLLEKVKCHLGEGGQKSVTYYLNGPLLVIAKKWVCDLHTKALWMVVTKLHLSDRLLMLQICFNVSQVWSLNYWKRSQTNFDWINIFKPFSNWLLTKKTFEQFAPKKNVFEFSKVSKNISINYVGGKILSKSRKELEWILCYIRWVFIRFTSFSCFFVIVLRGFITNDIKSCTMPYIFVFR